MDDDSDSEPSQSSSRSRSRSHSASSKRQLQDYNTLNLPSDFFISSESEAEDWTIDGENDPDRDWKVKVVGVEVVKGEELYCELQWPEWTRPSDGKSKNTYHRRGSPSFPILATELTTWDLSRKKRLQAEFTKNQAQSQLDTQLGSGSDDSDTDSDLDITTPLGLDIDIFPSTDLISTNTLYYAQGFDEKLREARRRPNLKRKVGVYRPGLGEILRKTEKRLLRGKLGKEGAKEWVSDEDSDSDGDTEEEEEDEEEEEGGIGRRLRTRRSTRSATATSVASSRRSQATRSSTLASASKPRLAKVPRTDGGTQGTQTPKSPSQQTSSASTVRVPHAQSTQRPLTSTNLPPPTPTLSSEPNRPKVPLPPSGFTSSFSQHPPISFLSSTQTSLSSESAGLNSASKPPSTTGLSKSTTSSLSTFFTFSVPSTSGTTSNLPKSLSASEFQGPSSTLGVRGFNPEIALLPKSKRKDFNIVVGTGTEKNGGRVIKAFPRGRIAARKNLGRGLSRASFGASSSSSGITEGADSGNGAGAGLGSGVRQKRNSAESIEYMDRTHISQIRNARGRFEAMFEKSREARTSASASTNKEKRLIKAKVRDADRPNSTEEGGEGGLEDDDDKSQSQMVVVPSLAMNIDETASGKDDVGKDRERGKKWKGKAKETRSRLCLLSLSFTEAALNAGAAPVRFINEVDDEDGPCFDLCAEREGDGEDFVYLESSRTTTIPHLLRSLPPDADLFLRCTKGCECTRSENLETEDSMRSHNAKSPKKRKGRKRKTAREGEYACECQGVSELQERAYTDEGLFRYALTPQNDDDGQHLLSGIEVVECNPYCHCVVSTSTSSVDATRAGNVNNNTAPTCLNRIAQRPRQVEIEIFKTSERGWGVRCGEDLKRGSVVGCYTGEIIHRSTAARLLGDAKTYVFDLDGYDQSSQEANGDEEELDEDIPMYSIDARRCGNWTRFLNHSCLPNLSVYTAVWDTIPEQNIPHLVFYAKEDIPRGTEMTVDYNPGEELPPLGSVRGAGQLGKGDLNPNTTMSKRKGKGKSKSKGNEALGALMRPWGSRECFCGAERCRGWV